MITTIFDPLRGLTWSNDVLFTIAIRIVSMYGNFLNWIGAVWGDGDQQVRRDQLAEWYPEPSQGPTFHSVRGLLVYFLNNFDLMDQLHQDEDGTYHMDTRDFNLHPPRAGGT